MGFILATMAGWIDTVGVRLFLNESPSFMTGRVKALGYHAFNLDFRAFFGIIVVILAFIFGAFISAKVSKRVGLMGGLILTGSLIFVGALPMCLKTMTVNTFLLPMAMGSQNAATSLTPINRTTHLTGPATDIGIYLANSNWKMVKFWIWRWIGFPLGSVIGFSLANLADKGLMSISTILIIPAVIIITTGILQKYIYNIPSL